MSAGVETSWCTPGRCCGVAALHQETFLWKPGILIIDSLVNKAFTSLRITSWSAVKIWNKTESEWRCLFRITWPAWEPLIGCSVFLFQLLFRFYFDRLQWTRHCQCCRGNWSESIYFISAINSLERRHFSPIGGKHLPSEFIYCFLFKINLIFRFCSRIGILFFSLYKNIRFTEQGLTLFHLF